jgi:hypothetical protein
MPSLLVSMRALVKKLLGPNRVIARGIVGATMEGFSGVGAGLDRTFAHRSLLAFGTCRPARGRSRTRAHRFASARLASSLGAAGPLGRGLASTGPIATPGWCR